MVTKVHYTTAKRERFKKNSHGVHAKTKSSRVKSSKNYQKLYVGQGRN